MINHKSNQVRIIAGKWRGRKITFPDSKGLRPTPDRVRETLFNWLAPYIQQRACLDLFAGSGALSFEALSRGAKKAVLVEANPEVVAYLQKTAQTLNTDACQIIQAEFPTITLQEKFDLVFLDPPFHQQKLPQCFAWLEKNTLLNPGAFIYAESETDLPADGIPTSWTCYRQQKAGNVHYFLFKAA